MHICIYFKVMYITYSLTPNSYLHIPIYIVNIYIAIYNTVVCVLHIIITEYQLYRCHMVVYIYIASIYIHL